MILPSLKYHCTSQRVQYFKEILTAVASSIILWGLFVVTQYSYGLYVTERSLVTHTWELYGSMFTGTAACSVTVNLLALSLCLQCSNFTRPVRYFLIFDVIGRALVSFYYLIAVFCAIHPNLTVCTESLFPFIINSLNWLLMPGSFISIFCQFGLSLNRFVAISFNGSFFKQTTRFPRSQVSFVILMPYVLYFGSAYLYDINATLTLVLESILETALVTIIISLDWITLYKIMKRRKGDYKQVDVKLGLQMIGNNLPYLWHRAFGMVLFIFVDYFFRSTTVYLESFDRILYYVGGHLLGGILTVHCLLSIARREGRSKQTISTLGDERTKASKLLYSLNPIRRAING